MAPVPYLVVIFANISTNLFALYNFILIKVKLFVCKRITTIGEKKV